MPFRPEHSLLNLKLENISTIDTRSVENLYGLWAVFSKTSNALEDGKRLENLSWRLWNRETFCCTGKQQCAKPAHSRNKPEAHKVPDLASSVDTVSTAESVEEEDPILQSPSAAPANIVRPELTRLDSVEGRNRGSQSHITPGRLEKIVVSIREKKPLELLEPLTISAPTPSTPKEDTDQKSVSTLRSPAQARPLSPRQRKVPVPLPLPSNKRKVESSASTTDARSSSNESGLDQASDSSSTAMSTHNVVRGFVPGGAPSSYRSQTNLAAQPTPILKNSPRNPSRMQSSRRKGAMFTLGGSSGEDESSLDSNMYKGSVSSISEGLGKGPSKKQASFRDEHLVSKVQDSPVFESEDEDDDDDDEDEVSESAIEDDEDSSDWEDEMGEDDDRSEADEHEMFQRVDSRPNLTSRRSLLTSLMHEGDRAKALQNAASRSTPALRRSRATSPNGPSLATSPQRQSQLSAEAQDRSRARPIIMTTSNTHQLALSPRTTRRNMLSTELTESLRKNLLWERQHKSSQNIAALKRRHTSTDVKNLKQHPEPLPNMSANPHTAQPFTNEYFHAGLGEFHTKGW